MSTYIAGFSLGLSLILAIGSQNAFVLKQGLKKRHVFIVCLVCAVSDALLISLGVAGFGTVVKQFPTIEIVARYGGAAFLTIYALLSFKSAFTQSHALEAEAETESSLFRTIAICLAFTWLNPHVYLDTVILLGSRLLCFSLVLDMARESWHRCLKTLKLGRSSSFSSGLLCLPWPYHWSRMSSL